jgi:hypothetical protein
MAHAMIVAQQTAAAPMGLSTSCWSALGGVIGALAMLIVRRCPFQGQELGNMDHDKESGQYVIQ